MQVIKSLVADRLGAACGTLVSYSCGTLELPSRALAVLEPLASMTTEIDAEIAARRIDVPGRALVTVVAAMMPEVGGEKPRPFAVVLHFSEAVAMTKTLVGDIHGGTSRMMFADAGMLADTWIRNREDERISEDLSLREAIERRLLSSEPILSASRDQYGHVMVVPGLMTCLTGLGECTVRIVRHDDAHGNLVRVVATFLDDDDCEPVEFLDFGHGASAEFPYLVRLDTDEGGIIPLSWYGTPWPWEPGPTAEQVMDAFRRLSMQNLAARAAVPITAEIGDWNDYDTFEAIPYADQYDVSFRMGTMPFFLTLWKSGSPIRRIDVEALAVVEDGTTRIVAITRKTLGKAADLRSARQDETPTVFVSTLDEATNRDILAGQSDFDGFRPPNRHGSLTARLADALAHIVDNIDSPEFDDPLILSQYLRYIAVSALALDHGRMRLRIDDQHGNRSFVQFLDGQWKAFRNDGLPVTLQYCFGTESDDAAIVRDLSAATDVHTLQTAAMRHVRGLQRVQVEMVSERHFWDGERFVHI